MLYKLLKTRSPDYDEVTWREVQLLYEGGAKIMRHAADFVPMLDNERSGRYADRLRKVAYIGYLAQIVGSLGSGLFEGGLDVTESIDAATLEKGEQPQDADGAPKTEDDEFWKEFATDADRKGTPFHMVMREAVEQALLKKRAIIACDFPDPGKKPESRAEEKQLEADRGYCYVLDLCELVDWEIDDQGRFEFAIIYETTQKRPSPYAPRGLVTHTWTIWTMGEREEPSADLADQYHQAVHSKDEKLAKAVFDKMQAKVGPAKAKGDKARWERYSLTVPAAWDGWQDDLDIPLEAEGESSFGRIPLVQLELPEGLWVGNQLHPMAVEHWCRRSELVGAQGRNLTAVTYVSLAKDDGGLGADALDGPTKSALKEQGVDVVVPGTMGVAEPAAQAYEVIGKDLAQLKDEMFRIVHQMAKSVDNSASSMRRSGESKKQDKTDEEVVLEALATFVKTAAVEVYETIGEARDENDVEWTARGLDKFGSVDRAELTAEGQALPLILDAVPSATWKKESIVQFAFKWTPNLPPATQDKIRTEIGEGVDSHQDLDDAMLENAKADEEDHVTPGQAHDDSTKVAMAAAKSGAQQGPPGAKGAPPAKKPANGAAKSGSVKT